MKNSLWRTAAFLFVICLLALPAGEGLAQENAAQAPLQLIRITPAGDNIQPTGQLTFQFSRPVVPLGNNLRSGADIPIEIEPKLGCRWLWLGPSQLACEIDSKQAMQLATAYQITVMPGIQTEDGQTLPAAVVHRFTTERPAARYANIQQWLGPETPLLNIGFSMPVTEQSVRQALALSFKHKGRGRRVTGQSLDIVAFPKTEPGQRDTHSTRQPVSSNWLVSPRSPLPRDTSVAVEVGPGLQSLFGPLTSQENVRLLSLETYPEFAFLGYKCRTLHNQEITVEIGPPTPEKCDPRGGISLQFSAPLFHSTAAQGIEITREDEESSETLSFWQSIAAEDQSYLFHSYFRPYDLQLPNPLGAQKTYRFRTFSGRTKFLTDIFGRKLKTRFDVEISTDDFHPSFVLTKPYAILEAGGREDVEAIVTNIDHFLLNYRRATYTGLAEGLRHSYQVSPPTKNTTASVPTGLRNLLVAPSGVIVGDFDLGPIYALNQPTTQNLYAILSPYQIELKLGYFNSQARVINLKTGEPVAVAEVKFTRDALEKSPHLAMPAVSSVTDENGVAMLPGRREIDLSQQLDPAKCQDIPAKNPNQTCGQLYVEVKKGPHYSLLPVSWDHQSQSSVDSRFYSPQASKHAHLRAWGTTPQGIYRAGSKVQYKIYVRDQSNTQMIAAPEGPYKLIISDPRGQEVHKVEDLKLSKFGSISGEFQLTENAGLGWYQFVLQADFAKGFHSLPIRFLVSDFTPAPFRVTAELSDDKFDSGQYLYLTTRAELHSGGPFPDADIRISRTISPSAFRSEQELSRDFTFHDAKRHKALTLPPQFVKTDEEGSLIFREKLPRAPFAFGRISAEGAVSDDQGRLIADTGSADYFSVDRLVGLHATSWIYAIGKTQSIEYIVVNQDGTPVSGTEVNLRIFHEKRSRNISPPYKLKIEKSLIVECQTSSSAQIEACSFEPMRSGNYRAEAEIKDSLGRPHMSQITFWVSGSRAEPEDSASEDLTLSAEKEQYQVGEKARILVRNFKPGAKALVSIERFGVIHSWTQPLENNHPFIEFDVRPEDSPGIYLGVTLFNPRSSPRPENSEKEDLGRPKSESAYVTLKVSDPAKVIDLDVRPEKPLYRPGESVTIAVNAKQNGGPAEPTELAVIVLDEAVLDLLAAGEAAFDPEKGLRGLEGRDLSNFSLFNEQLARVTYLRQPASFSSSSDALTTNFEEISPEAAGAGPAVSFRQQFASVAYWTPSLETDAAGNAEFTFQPPDNLTGWRVFVLAASPTDKLGLGQGKFAVNKLTEIRPAAPNQVTEGDTFAAGFTIMNRADHARTIEVKVTAEGDATAGTLMETLNLNSHARQTVHLPVEAKILTQERGVLEGEIRFTVTAGDREDRDGLRHNIAVTKPRLLRTATHFESFTGGEWHGSITIPDKVFTDIGEVQTTLSPSLISGLRGTVDALRDLPYPSWEHLLTRAVAATQVEALAPYFGDQVLWPDRQNLVSKALKEVVNFQAPSGGMAYFIAEDNSVSPYLSAYTSLAFSWLQASGVQVPEEAKDKLNDYLRRFLDDQKERDQNSAPAHISTTRATALAALSAHGRAKLADFEYEQKYLTRMSVFGKAMFLQAAIHVPHSESLQQAAAISLLNSANFGSGKLRFAEDRYLSPFNLGSAQRSACAALSAFTLLPKIGQPVDVVEMPMKIIQAMIEERGAKDHFGNSQENIFCLQALGTYTQRFEKIPPKVTAKVEFVDEKQYETRFSGFRDPPLTLSHPLQPGDPGKALNHSVSAEGEGRLYHTTRLRFALNQKQNEISVAGIELRREHSVERDGKWVVLDGKTTAAQGDLIRTDLFLSVPAVRYYVALVDPLAGGLEPLNQELATTSQVDTGKVSDEIPINSWIRNQSEWTAYRPYPLHFYHRELGHDQVRYYADYLAAGKYRLSYVARAIASGTFRQPPAKIEEIYQSDTYGASEEKELVIRPNN